MVFCRKKADRKEKYFVYNVVYIKTRFSRKSIDYNRVSKFLIVFGSTCSPLIIHTTTRRNEYCVTIYNEQRKTIEKKRLNALETWYSVFYIVVTYINVYAFRTYLFAALFRDNLLLAKDLFLGDMVFSHFNILLMLCTIKYKYNTQYQLFVHCHCLFKLDVTSIIRVMYVIIARERNIKLGLRKDTKRTARLLFAGYL